jgi:excinuclease ABC subunit A
MNRVAEVRYQGCNIADVNGLTVSESLQLFTREPTIIRYLKFLDDAALDYLVLGQPSNTLSGGEAQRIKVASKLCKRLGDRSVYILDNPFRGIGNQAIPRVYEALRKLVDKNNTVVIAENHSWVAGQADWLIALGRPRISRGDHQLNYLRQGPPPKDIESLWSQVTIGGNGR